MLQTVTGGQCRCALVIRLEDGVDDDLLAAIDGATGLGFQPYGDGGLGGETLASVYAADDNLLMEVLCDEVGVKALFVWANSAEQAVAVRAVIGDRLPVWSEQMLRAQLADSVAEQPLTLVALLMAAGGAAPEPETLDLLQRALDHDDEEVRQAAEYARLVASELVHPPVVMREEPERPQEILRQASPVPGDQRWVTVRAGVPDRAVPRAVTYCPMDERTALHVVRHPALAQVHVALHGDEVDATAAALVADLGAEILHGPPAGWERTAP